VIHCGCEWIAEEVDERPGHDRQVIDIDWNLLFQGVLIGASVLPS
jgi:hypothetical protein